MLILDEARLFSRSSHVRRKIRDWLKTLRKQNVSVFATQSVEDVSRQKSRPHYWNHAPREFYYRTIARLRQKRESYEKLDSMNANYKS